jgi:hypothetical protein
MIAVLELIVLSVFVGAMSGLHLAAQGGPAVPERYHLGRR